VQGQTKGLDINQALLYSLEKQNLDLSKLVGVPTGVLPSFQPSAGVGPQNGLMLYQCIIHQQHVIAKDVSRYLCSFSYFC
jgi:hypothetical protein